MRFDGASPNGARAVLAVVEAREDVQVDGHVERLGGLPQRVVVTGREGQVGMWHLPDQGPDHTGLGAPLKLLDGVVDVVARDAGDGVETLRRHAAVVDDPVVIGPDAGQLQGAIIAVERIEIARHGRI